MLRPPSEGHPSDYVVRDLVDALVRAGVPELRAPRLIGKVSARATRRPPRIGAHHILVPTMGQRFGLLYSAAVRGTPIPFAWDVWQPAWDDWVEHLRVLRPPLIFATAPGSASFLESRLPFARVVCVPEATNVSRYQPGPPLEQRQVDVLELGRRHPRWHESITAPAAEAGVAHVYERRAGELIFADEAGLVAGLADSRVSVCFPSSETSPERSGSVATMTHRYLESIASRCVVLGRAPDQLVNLFGFDPVVAADLDQAWLQLREVLTDVARYQPLVDRAYARLRDVGSWDARVQDVLTHVDGIL